MIQLGNPSDQRFVSLAKKIQLRINISGMSAILFAQMSVIKEKMIIGPGTARRMTIVIERKNATPLKV
jgi:hypothetical protein